MWAWLAESWRVGVIIVTGVPVVVSRRRPPGWVLGTWGLLVGAVGLAWLVGWSWVGTVGVFLALLLIGSAVWLRAQERA